MKISLVFSFVFLFILLSSGCSSARGTRKRGTFLKKWRERRQSQETSSKPYLHNKKTVQYKKLSNVEKERLSLDIYYKDDHKNKKPVLIWVHGGSFHLGDKAQGIESLRDMALANDWILAAVNYRLSPKPKFIKSRMDKNRIKYPDHNNDIVDAIKWLYENIARYGGDSKNFALIGHSAGAHLVSLMGTNKKFIESRKLSFSIIKAIVSVDIDTYDVRPYVEKGIPMMVNAFGEDKVLNRDASPIHNLKLGESYPRFLVFVRGRDGR